MPYKLTINGKTEPWDSFTEVRAEIAALVTDRLAVAPDRVGSDAQMINAAFNTGAVEEALAERGEWFTILDAHGDDPQRIKVTKED